MNPKNPEYCPAQSRVAEDWGGNKTTIPCTFNTCEKGRLGIGVRVCQFAMQQESSNQDQISLDGPNVIEPTK